MPSASREAHGQLDGNGNQANSGHGHYQRVASPHRPRESRLCRYPAGRPDYIPRTRLAAYAYRHSTMTATAPTRGSCRTSTSITSPSRHTSSRNTCKTLPHACRCHRGRRGDLSSGYDASTACAWLACLQRCGRGQVGASADARRVSLFHEEGSVAAEKRNNMCGYPCLRSLPRHLNSSLEPPPCPAECAQRILVVLNKCTGHIFMMSRTTLVHCLEGD